MTKEIRTKDYVVWITPTGETAYGCTYKKGTIWGWLREATVEDVEKICQDVLAGLYATPKDVPGFQLPKLPSK